MSLDFQRLERILAEAAAKGDAEERAAYLAQACGGDLELRAEVERLLAAHEQAGDFLESPFQPIPDKTNVVSEPDIAIERAGAMIGRYKLLEEIGEGGFGVVYMAEQVEPVQRKVALKIIKAGMDTREVVARFEAERQALALMDHPNIAQVFDGGATQTGRPYFVMELVRGVAITEFCDQQKLSTRERLQLFIQVCHAVQHAHQKGIIHRDLKPSNILVTLIDGEAVPKIIDFGVAKALGQKLTDKTLFTSFLRMVGTPAYMSPEQADLSGVDIDTRADIYALGVLLYELLTGSTPFDAETLRKAALDEIQRMIRETEPPKPSTRLQALVAADERRLKPTDNRQPTEEEIRASSRRLLQIKEKIRLVRGDLDWIAMKCLEKDRRRRYETANSLASDIERHLNHEPVIAAAPSTVYRARKFISRHKAGLAVTGALVLLLAGGVIVSTWQAVRATRAERSESQMRQRAETEKTHAETHARQAQEEKELARFNLYVAHISQIQQELKNQRVGPALRLLEQQQPRKGEEDFRSFEWYYLWGQCQRGLRATLRGHEKPVSSVAFSPDGTALLSGSSDGTIRLWSISTGQERTILASNQSPVECVKFSPDGKSLAWGCSNGTITIWDVAQQTVRTNIQAHKGAIRNLAFSPNSQTMASAGKDGAVRIWDVQTGSTAGPAVGPGEWIDALAFSPDGRTLAANAYGKIRLYDVPSCRLRRTLAGHRFWIKWLGFTSDGKILVSGGNNTTIKFWDVATGREQTDLEQEGGEVVSLSPDGRRLAVGFDDGTVGVKELASGQKRLYGNSDTILDFAFSPNGRLLASASADRTIKLWELTSQSDLPALKNLEKRVWTVAFSPDGKLLASAGGHQPVRLWDVATGQQLASLGPGGICVTFSPDGKTLAFADYVDVVLWDVGTRQPRKALKGHKRAVFGVKFSADGKTLASAAQDHSVILWSVATGQARATLTGHKGNWMLASLAFSPDGRTLASANGEWCWNSGQVILWDAASGQRRTMLPDATTCVAFSPDGKTLASGLVGGKVALWNPDNGQKLAEMSGHVKCGNKMAFSPDGQTLFSCNSEGAVTFWDLIHKRERAVLKKSGHSVYSLAISPDGKTLATGGEEGNVEFWRADREHEASQRGQTFASRLRLAGNLSRRGMLLQERGQAKEAEQAYQEAMTLYEKLAAEFPDRAEYRQSLAATYRQLSGLMANSPQMDAQHYKRALELVGKAIELTGDNPDLAREEAALWHRKGKLLETADETESALRAFTKAIELAGATRNAQRLALKGALLSRSSLLRRMNRPAEAAADRRRAIDIPLRNPQAKTNLVDLSLFYNAGLKENIHADRPDTDLAALPTGIQTLGGTQFDIRGLIEVSRCLPSCPSSVSNIPVGQVCQRLHFLHAAFDAGSTPDGSQIGRYLVHYSNGEQQEIPIVAGRDVADWWQQPGEEGKPLVVVWKGTNGETHNRGIGIRLFKTTWTNPEPDLAVQSIDFEALDKQASPFVVAITAE